MTPEEIRNRIKTQTQAGDDVIYWDYRRNHNDEWFYTRQDPTAFRIKRPLGSPWWTITWLPHNAHITHDDGGDFICPFEAQNNIYRALFTAKDLTATVISSMPKEDYLAQRERHAKYMIETYGNNENMIIMPPPGDEIICDLCNDSIDDPMLITLSGADPYTICRTCAQRATGDEYPHSRVPVKDIELRYVLTGAEVQWTATCHDFTTANQIVAGWAERTESGAMRRIQAGVQWVDGRTYLAQFLICYEDQDNDNLIGRHLLESIRYWSGQHRPLGLSIAKYKSDTDNPENAGLRHDCQEMLAFYDIAIDPDTV